MCRVRHLRSTEGRLSRIIRRRDVSDHHDLDALRRAELERLFAGFVRYRLFAMPFAVGFIIALFVIDPAPWRRMVLVGTFATALTIALVEARRYHSRANRSVGLSLAAIALLQGVLIFATGALESPVIPGLLILSEVAGLIIGPRRALALFAAVPISAIWVFTVGQIYALLPAVTLDIFGGGVRAGHNDPLLWTAAVLLTVCVVMACGIGATFHAAFGAMLARVTRASDEILATHKHQLGELTALSGEIAHELKNPLASVKGLATLIRRDIPEGRTAERMDVLNGEVERMQEIIEEFLAFSRPLLPLHIQPVVVEPICHEILQLHEAVAQDLMVQTALNVDPGLALQCDPRKLKQILINLVQNAFDAAPSGSTVEICARGVDEDVQIEVLDAGAGIDPAVRDRIFEAGVTAKSQGTGLGLTISRAMARQHGGALALQDRDGGGCSASLRLPKAPQIDEETP